VTADDYLGRVAFMLRDLPWRTRRELVAELRAHLTELPADTDLEARLGAPEQYAADLRSAAGLERRRGAIAFLRARRPRSVILAALALTALGLAIGTVAWVQTYQPLAFGNGYSEPRGTIVAPAGGASVTFHEGASFRYSLEIRNTGRFAVRVLGVPYYPPLVSSVRLLMSGPTGHGGLDGPFRRFRPLDLPPGRTFFLVLRGVYDASCGSYASGGLTLFSELPVRFSFLWRTATAHIALPEKLAIVVPKGGGGSCR